MVSDGRGIDLVGQLERGIESDIRAGSLDYPDDILARFGFVIAQCAQSVPTAARRANGAHRQSRREPIYNHTRPSDWPPAPATAWIAGRRGTYARGLRVRRRRRKD